MKLICKCGHEKSWHGKKGDCYVLSISEPKIGKRIDCKCMKFEAVEKSHGSPSYTNCECPKCKTKKGCGICGGKGDVQVVTKEPCPNCKPNNSQQKICKTHKEVGVTCDYCEPKTNTSTLSNKIWNITISGYKGTKYHKGFLEEDVKESIKEILFHKKCLNCKLNLCGCGKCEWVIDVNIIKEEFGKGLT